MLAEEMSAEHPMTPLCLGQAKLFPSALAKLFQGDWEGQAHQQPLLCLWQTAKFIRVAEQWRLKYGPYDDGQCLSTLQWLSCFDGAV